MSLLRSGLGALAVLTTVAVSSVAPAQAQSVQFSFGQRQQMIYSYCDTHPRDRDCRGYRDGRWRNSDYDGFYHSHRSGLDSIGTGLFGLGAAAIIGGVIANSVNNNNGGDHLVGRAGDSDHTAACYARYRSYNEGSDTYVGYDGRRHACNL